MTKDKKVWWVDWELCYVLGTQVVAWGSRKWSKDTRGRWRKEFSPALVPSWNHNGGNYFRPLKIDTHAVLAALLWFAVATLYICHSHWSASWAVPWMYHELFSVHMPGSLIIHNFLIPGSSQEQQMLLLPLLLNKVGSKERNLSIVFLCWNRNKKLCVVYCPVVTHVPNPCFV